MYEADLSPLGLFVVEGRELRAAIVRQHSRMFDASVGKWYPA